MRAVFSARPRIHTWATPEPSTPTKAIDRPSGDTAGASITSVLSGGRIARFSCCSAWRSPRKTATTDARADCRARRIASAVPATSGRHRDRPRAGATLTAGAGAGRGERRSDATASSAKGEVVRRMETFGRVFFETAPDDAVEARGDSDQIDLRQLLWIVVQDRTDRVGRRVSPETPGGPRAFRRAAHRN